MKKILVVVDMQNDFIDGPLGTPEARAIVDNVCRKIREGEWDEIYMTKDTHFDNYLETTEGQKLPIEHCIDNTPGWELHDDVIDASEVGAKIVHKFTFASPKLVRYICDLGDKCEITLVGVCTDICVISNALLLKAYFPEARIVVDASCSAGTTPAKHLMALEVMESCQIDIENKPCAWLKLMGKYEG